MANRGANASALDLNSEQKRSWNDLNQPPYNAFRNSSKLAKPQSGTLNWLVEEFDKSGPTDQSESVSERTLSNKDFITWRDSDTSESLLVVAPPGRGKSVLSNFVLQHLESQTDNNPVVTTKTIYYFCNIKEAETSRNARSLLRALIVQLCERQQRLFSLLLTEYETKSERFFDAPFDTLWHIFEQMLQDEAYGRINCVIDGLDVYQNEMDELIDKLSMGVARPQVRNSPILKFFYTSRPGEHLSQWPFEHHVFLRCNQQDLDCFINSRISNLGRSFTEEMREVIKYECNAQADKTFLWLEVVFRKIKLLAFPNTQKIKDAIQKSSHHLFKLYEGLIHEIRGDADAVRLLAWVAYAKERMNLASLEDALAVHLEDRCTSLQTRRLKKARLTVEEVFKTCGTILDVIEERVYFIHQSVKDYFEEEDPLKSLLGIPPRLLPGYTCLAYMCSEDFRQEREDFEEFPLFSYAFRYWHYHIESTADIISSDSLPDLLVQLIAPFQLVSWSHKTRLLDLIWKHELSMKPDNRQKHHPLRRYDEVNFKPLLTSEIAMFYDIGWLAKLLLDNTVADLPNDFTEDCLFEAAEHKGEVLRTLLEHDYSVTFPLKSQAIEMIAEQHNHELFKLLVEKRGQDVCFGSGVAAAAAANTGHAREVMRLLLQVGGDSFHITSDLLEIAARNPISGKNLLELLFDQSGDEVHITSGVLKAASANTFSGENILILLFSKMSDEMKITQDVVKAAAGNMISGKQIVKLLIDRGARVDDDVLQVAARNSSAGLDILKMLYNERGNEIHVTADVLAAAGENWLHGEKVLALLLSNPERHAAGLCITNNIVVKAAGNISSGLEMTQLLLDWRPEEVHITMEVLREIGRAGRKTKTLMLLLERRADDTHVTKKIAERIVQHFSNDVIRLIRERCSEDHFMSQHVIRLLANNLVYHTTFEEQIEDLKTLLALGADANFVSDDDWTPLTLAASRGDLLTVELLVANNAEVSFRPTTNLSPLGLAAYFGHVDVVKLLLDKSAGLSVAQKGATGLIPTVPLPERQAYVDAIDDDGRTPLALASLNGHLKVVKLLIEQGADLAVSNNYGWTPLNAASGRGHLETVRLLLSQGANPLVVGQSGWSPLDSAAKSGQVEIVKLLLEHESFDTIDDKHSLCGTIANTLAFFGHTDLLQYIVQHKNADLQTPDASKRTPLLFAARGGHVQTFEYLVDYGSSLATLDAKGDGLISYAASSGCLQLLEVVLGKGLEYSPQPGHWSPLHWACRSGNMKVVEMIVEAMIAKHWQRVPITITDAKGEWTRKWTPRAIAIFHGHGDMLKDLSEASQAALGISNTIVHAQGKRRNALCDYCLLVSQLLLQFEPSD